MLGSNFLSDPFGKKSGEGVHFVLREPHRVAFSVVQDSEALADGTWSGDVSGSLGESKAEVICQSQEGIEINLGQAFRRNSKEIIHVPARTVVSTITMAGARTRYT